MIPIAAVGLVVVMTLLLGTTGLRYARTTSNFFVASRSVHPVWNAFAVCGEAMSAASYLGVPALILVFGFESLWPLVGWTIGFLLLSLFIAAPIRRFGSYTIPEFIEGRLDSPLLRQVMAVMVIVVSWFFFLAQLKGAGVVTRALLGTPFWVGVVAVAVLVAINLSAGGMRGITFVQGFQFFFIFLGILVPFAVLSTIWFRGDLEPIVVDEFPVFFEETAVDYPNDVSIVVSEAVRVEVVEGTVVPSTDVEGAAAEAVAGFVDLPQGVHAVSAGSLITWPQGASAPHASTIDSLTGTDWAQPLGDKSVGGGQPLYFSFAIVIANMFGIMGFPHILVRFYTNPTGREARRTNLIVLALLAPYYAMLPLFGAASRVLSPGLLGAATTDSATVSIGERLVEGTAGELITAIVSAGAAAAFLSTSSGLLIAMGGAVSHDLMSAGVRQFRVAVCAVAAVSILVALAVETTDINVLIGWSTSIAASSITPLLMLGIWWKGLTRHGALAAIVVGGGASTSAVLLTLFGFVDSGWPLAVLGTPAVWSVPLAFGVGIFVSLRDNEIVSNLGHKFALMHVPDQFEPVDE